MSLRFEDLSEDSKLEELKKFIQQEKLNASPATGGQSHRTKKDIYNDIKEEIRQKHKEVAKPKLVVIKKEERSPNSGKLVKEDEEDGFEDGSDDSDCDDSSESEYESQSESQSDDEKDRPKPRVIPCGKATALGHMISNKLPLRSLCIPVPNDQGELKEGDFQRWDPPMEAVADISESLKDMLKRYRECFCIKEQNSPWKVRSEAAARTFIDLILLEASRKCNFFVYCEYDCKSRILKDVKLRAVLDYVLSKVSAKNKFERSKIPVRLFIEAKRAFQKDSKDINQVVAQMICCHYSMTTDPVDIYAARTNGRRWQFYKMDSNRRITASRVYVVNKQGHDDLKQVIGILQKLLSMCHPVKRELTYNNA